MALIDKLKISDIKLICEMPRHKSMRSLAQDFGQTPQNMSKIIKSIEECIGQTLLLRSSSGYSPTSFCLSLAEQFSTLLGQFYEVDLSDRGVKSPKSRSYIFCARVFMNVCLAPELSSQVSSTFPEVQFKFVDASPKKKMEWARSNLLDIVLSVDELDIGKDWSETHVGSIQRSFYVKSNHPLGRSCQISEFVKYPFVGFSHVDVNHIGYTTGPSYPKLKIKNNQSFTETHLAAMTIASKTHQVCMIPDLLVQALGFDIKLQRLEINGLNPIKQKIYLYTHKDRVAALHMRKIVSILNDALK